MTSILAQMRRFEVREVDHEAKSVTIIYVYRCPYCNAEVSDWRKAKIYKHFKECRREFYEGGVET